mgnify:CR=1 FL=1
MGAVWGLGFMQGPGPRWSSHIGVVPSGVLGGMGGGVAGEDADAAERAAGAEEEISGECEQVPHEEAPPIASQRTAPMRVVTNRAAITTHHPWGSFRAKCGGRGATGSAGHRCPDSPCCSGRGRAACRSGTTHRRAHRRSRCRSRTPSARRRCRSRSGPTCPPRRVSRCGLSRLSEGPVGGALRR